MAERYTIAAVENRTGNRGRHYTVNGVFAGFAVPAVRTYIRNVRQRLGYAFEDEPPLEIAREACYVADCFDTVLYNEGNGWKLGECTWGTFKKAAPFK